MQTHAGMSAHSFPWGELSSRIHFFPLSFAKLGWGEKLGIPRGPPRSLSCPSRVAWSRSSSGRVRESQKDPQPLTYHLQELPQSQRLLSFLQACGHLNSPILAGLSPGQGGAGALGIFQRQLRVTGRCYSVIGWSGRVYLPKNPSPALSPQESCSGFPHPFGPSRPSTECC